VKTLLVADAFCKIDLLPAARLGRPTGETNPRLWMFCEAAKATFCVVILFTV
jgi:hypothetical protein